MPLSLAQTTAPLLPLAPLAPLITATQPTTQAAAATADPSVLTLSPFVLLLLAIPVLFLGEALLRRFHSLRRLNIPAPVVGGLIVALLILAVQEVFGPVLQIVSSTPDVAWHWVVLPQWDFAAIKPASVTQPLLILFFTCIGLNASWAVARTGGLPLLLYLFLAGFLAVVQYVTGIVSALAVGQSPLLGIMCSGVSLMGGFGTAAGFAPEFVKAGLPNAGGIGVASAAFGVIVGGLIAGPMAARLMSAHNLSNNLSGTHAPALSPQTTPDADEDDDDQGFVGDLAQLTRRLTPTLIHLAALLLCLKLGAFLSVAVKTYGTQLIRSLPGADPEFTLTFPVYMGSMIVAVLLRNLHDALGLRLISSRHVDLLASFALAWLLSAIMIGLRLIDLLELALPMLVILIGQVVVMVVFSYYLVFRVMGKNYESAAMSAGMIGFGLGATSNAVATMNAMARQYGPAPRAFLIVTVVGAFLIDFINSFLILTLLNLFK